MTLKIKSQQDHSSNMYHVSLCSAFLQLHMETSVPARTCTWPAHHSHTAAVTHPNTDSKEKNNGNWSPASLHYIADSMEDVDFSVLFLTDVTVGTCSSPMGEGFVACFILSATHSAVSLASASWSQHSSIVCNRLSIPWKEPVETLPVGNSLIGRFAVAVSS